MPRVSGPSPEPCFPIFDLRAIAPCSTLCRFRRTEALERTLVEDAAGLHVDRIPPGEGLPPSDGYIDVSGLPFQTVRATSLHAPQPSAWCPIRKKYRERYLGAVCSFPFAVVKADNGLIGGDAQRSSPSGLGSKPWASERLGAGCENHHQLRRSRASRGSEKAN